MYSLMFLLGLGLTHQLFQYTGSLATHRHIQPVYIYIHIIIHSLSSSCEPYVYFSYVYTCLSLVACSMMFSFTGIRLKAETRELLLPFDMLIYFKTEGEEEKVLERAREGEILREKLTTPNIYGAWALPLLVLHFAAFKLYSVSLYLERNTITSLIAALLITVSSFTLSATHSY